MCQILRTLWFYLFQCKTKDQPGAAQIGTARKAQNLYEGLLCFGQKLLYSRLVRFKKHVTIFENLKKFVKHFVEN